MQFALMPQLTSDNLYPCEFLEIDVDPSVSITASLNAGKGITVLATDPLSVGSLYTGGRGEVILELGLRCWPVPGLVDLQENLAMPKRTNRFQGVVDGICRALGGPHYRIRESVLLDDTCGKPYEVDIVIEDACGSSTSRIVIECKDESRPMDIGGLNTYVGRHTGRCRLEADRVVIVTRSGFSERAVFRAEAEGLELYTLVEEENPKWPPSGPMKFFLDRPIVVSGYSLTPDHTEEAPSPLTRLTCKKCLRDHGTLGRFLDRELRNRILPEYPEFVANLMEAAKSSPLRIARACFGVQIDDLLLDVKGQPCTFERVDVEFEARHGDTEVTVRDYKLSSIDGASSFFRTWEAAFPQVGDLEGGDLCIVASAEDFPRHWYPKFEPRKANKAEGSKPATRGPRERQKSLCRCGSGKKFKHCHGKRP